MKNYCRITLKMLVCKNLKPRSTSKLHSFFGLLNQISQIKCYKTLFIELVYNKTINKSEEKKIS